MNEPEKRLGGTGHCLGDMSSLRNRALGVAAAQCVGWLSLAIRALMNRSTRCATVLKTATPFDL
jgi:hypothetical protein